MEEDALKAKILLFIGLGGLFLFFLATVLLSISATKTYIIAKDYPEAKAYVVEYKKRDVSDKETYYDYTFIYKVDGSFYSGSRSNTSERPFKPHRAVIVKEFSVVGSFILRYNPEMPSTYVMPSEMTFPWIAYFAMVFMGFFFSWRYSSSERCFFIPAGKSKLPMMPLFMPPLQDSDRFLINLSVPCRCAMLVESSSRPGE